jgi:hypothetical protein
MKEQDWLAQRFEKDRAHLKAVAYRMRTLSHCSRDRPLVAQAAATLRLARLKFDQ